MLSFSFDPGNIEKTIDAIVTNIAGLAEKVPAELTQWQTEDMHRVRPNTTIIEQDTSGPPKLGAPKVTVSVMTEIWPRSRLSMAQQAQVLNTRRRRRSPNMRPTAVKWRRPVLRPELYQKLIERMRALLRSAIPWA